MRRTTTGNDDGAKRPSALRARAAPAVVRGVASANSLVTLLLLLSTSSPAMITPVRASAAAASPIKECMAPLRTKSTDPCPVPTVQTPFCHGESCTKWPITRISTTKDGSSSPTTTAAASSSSDTCTIVTHALLSEFPVFDVVFLPSELCQSEIAAGPFLRKDAVRALPRNEQLIGIQWNGSDLLAALEHGIDLYHGNVRSSSSKTCPQQQVQQQANQRLDRVSPIDGYPRVAGIRFKVSPNRPYPTRVSEAQVLSHNCQWLALEESKYYHVLVPESMMPTSWKTKNDSDSDYDKWNYAPYTSRAVTKVGTGIGLTDAFFFHAQSVCVVRDPFRSPNQPQQPQPQRSQSSGFFVSTAAGTAAKTIVQMTPSKSLSSLQNRTKPAQFKVIQ